MRVEVWSDVVCPWCYIGKRRLAAALAGFEHAGEVEILYRSFELDPTAPRVPTETTVESLARRWGAEEADVLETMRQGDAVAAEVGLQLRHHNAPHASTFDAHRLLHLARAGGVQPELKEALLAAYFARGESMGDHEVLRRAAIGVGLDPGRVEAVLAGTDYAEEVRADIELARALGASAVPFHLIDRRYAITGAQPVEVFAEVLERAWAELG